MSLFICSLNSGSNGNCYYVGNNDDAVLIDAGLSCKATEARMKNAGLNMLKLRAIFISHEHGDHIRGVATLAVKYNLPVYATPATCSNCTQIPKSHARHFSAFTGIRIGNISVTAFPKFHDAADPHSFIVSHKQATVGVFTDIGKVCKQVRQYFLKCDAVFLESNYDAEMLDKGRYPIYLKNRIRNGHGHLSNAEALDLFLQHKSLSHLLLSHLSANNNCPDLVTDLFGRYAGNTTVTVASRFKSSPVYEITGGSCAPTVNKKITQLAFAGF